MVITMTRQFELRGIEDIKMLSLIIFICHSVTIIAVLLINFARGGSFYISIYFISELIYSIGIFPIIVFSIYFVNKINKSIFAIIALLLTINLVFSYYFLRWYPLIALLLATAINTTTITVLFEFIKNTITIKGNYEKKGKSYFLLAMAIIFSIFWAGKTTFFYSKCLENKKYGLLKNNEEECQLWEYIIGIPGL